jgi:hypothetical protein
MNIRFVQFSIDELAIDQGSISDALNEACSRDDSHYRITGVCQTTDAVIFPLEEVENGDRWHYVLSAFTDIDDDDVIADICSRWKSGFTTKGLIKLNHSFLGLFELPD